MQQNKELIMNPARLMSKSKKVVFIMGATGAGKSRLSIDLAVHFSAEIINSDKIQVYKGLDIVANKLSETDRKGVPHHLMELVVEPDVEFTAHDFSIEAVSAIDKIISLGKLPIIVGGSNSFLEALVENPLYDFKSTYDCSFIWVDMSFPVHHSFVSKRVDQMVEAGLIDEVRGIFNKEADYEKGLRKAIGVPEMHEYFVSESRLDEASKKVLLKSAIDKIKENTCKLVSQQVSKIKRLKEELHWPIIRFDVTPVFMKTGDEFNTAWNEVVLQPSIKTVAQFLEKENINY